jgi:hypothetical protein
MCIKKIQSWFHKPDPIPETGKKKTALLFAINDYSGSANDLNGCLNDQRDMAKKLEELWPGEFDIKKFSDSQVTRETYKNEVTKAIWQLSPGATVIVIADSCFSGTITRFFNQQSQNRFHRNPGFSLRGKLNKKYASNPVKWLTFAMCQENQTSSDAYISGEYHGAGTYFALKAFRKGMTFNEWEIATQLYLPSSAFDQAPYIEGPEDIKNRIVGEGETLIIHNSSHGTQTYDPHGDETDGYDEALYLYDGMVTDDEINAILQRIPVLT